MNSGRDESVGGETDGSDVSDGDDLTPELAEISLTPEQHQRIKNLVNGTQLDRIKGHDRRYLVVGSGDDDGAATRRKTVYDRLDSRRDPPAVAFQLEDFGLTRDEIDLWCRMFDILCDRATHIVAVIEDFDGGYVWELGLLYAPSYREIVGVLKRLYPDEEIERQRYDNGMAASHMSRLPSGDRCIEWEDVDELPEAVDEIP